MKDPKAAPVGKPRLVQNPTRRIAAAVAAVLVVTMAGQLPAGPAAAADWKPPKPKEAAGVPRHAAVHKQRPTWTAAEREVRATPKVMWPAPGTATVDLATSGKAGTSARATAPSRVRAGSLPIWAAATPAATTSAAGGVAKLSVTVRDRQTAQQAGVSGLVFDVSRADGVRRSGSASVTVDYSAFGQAYGGDWASRLRIVDLASGQALPGVNDTTGSTVTAQVALPADDAVTALAVDAGPAGDNGTYAATGLSQAGTWQVSQQTGAFAWGLPLRMPPAVNGPSPSLSLSYSSQSIDGRTAGTNTQGSWIGDGWDMWPGYIERQYTGCSDDKDPIRNGNANNADVDGGDLCWLKPDGNATLSLNGQATELVKSAGNTWKGVTDNGDKIELLRDTTFGNGDDDDEYWRVTTTDGTQYYFGRNHGVGGASASTATNSVWTVPVYGNHPDEPGYKAGDFAGSRRTQAWRWNLDYVVDTHANTMTMFYDKETSAYAREADADKRTTYDRGGFLTTIEYGNRSNSAGTTRATAKVAFEPADRCASNCYADGDPVEASWADTPWDLSCDQAPCAGKFWPTFWTSKRLAKITTQVYSGSGSTYRDVDQWTLRHTYLQAGGGESRPMWLSGVTHSGRVTSTDGTYATTDGNVTTDPEIVFDPGQDGMANRVDGPADNRSNLFRSRIRTITTESGAQIGITYSGPACSRSALPAESTNTQRCFPQYFAPPGEEPTLDWFHHYRVARVDVYDNTGGFTHEQANYDYLDTPAWHHDDSELVDPDKRTWGQFRGYSKVRVRKGLESGVQSATEYLYFRGMDGDKQTSGVRDVSITDSQNVSIRDDDAYAGTLREQSTLLGAGGDWVTGTIYTPGKQGPTATSGPLKAFMTNTATTRSRSRLAGGGTRWVKTTTAYNTDNLPTAVDDFGDEATTVDDRCSRTWYARNGGNWILGAVKRTETVGVNCSATASLPADMLASSRTTYDIHTNNWDTDLPVKGDIAKVEEIGSWTATTPNWVQVTRSVYDDAGRIRDSFDALNRKTSTVYSPTDLTGPVTQTTVTDPLLNTVTTRLHPAWGVVTKATDPNNLVTDMAYDGSGRLTRVWTPGRAKSSFANFPNISYSYQIRSSAPTAVTTKTLLPNGSNTYATQITLYDGLMRQRQTQTQATGGGRVITDAVYDSRGLTDWTSVPYYDTTNTPPNADDLAGGPGDPPPPSTNITIYDGAERLTTSVFMIGTVEKWRTTTTYHGDRTDILPPTGGTASSGTIDARGRQTQVWRYKNPADLGSTDPAKFDRTSYTYTDRGEIATMVDPAGNTWKNGYDQRGRQTRTEDPDAGITTATYDAAGQLTTTTDARNITLAYTYDDAGRKKTLRDGSVTGTIRAEWFYDQLTRGIGKLNKSVRYANGQQYSSEVSAFDTAGRPTGTKTTIPTTEGTLCAAGGSTPCTFTTGVTYRANGQVGSTSLPAVADLPAELVAQGYNDIGAPTDLVSATQVYVQGVTYNKLGQLTQQILGQEPQRVWLTSTYEDHTGRIKNHTAQPEAKPEIFNLNYEKDKAGNLTRISDTPAGGQSDTQCYAYDGLQRLTEAWTPANGNCETARSATTLGGPAPYWHSYEYTGAEGASGSRTKETWHATSGDTTRTYTYPAQGGAAGTKPHAVTKVTTSGASIRTENYQYDPSGNTTCRPAAAATNTCPTGSSQALTWDAEQRQATNSSNASSYIYDADGSRLIRKDSTATTLYLPDGTEIRKTASAVTANRYYGGVAMRTATGVTWLASDHHATAEASINGSTLAVGRRRTLPFGNERGTTSGAWPTLMDKGFVGGTKDSTGLTHLGAREYDTWTGKFISVDPLQDLTDSQQWNGYAYAGNNPATLSDPDGLWAKDPDLDDSVGRAKPKTGKKTNHGYNHKNHKESSEAKGKATVIEDGYKQPRLVCFSGFYCIDAMQITDIDAYVASYNASVAARSAGNGGQTLEDYQYAEAMLSGCMVAPWTLANCGSPLYHDLKNSADQASITAAQKNNKDGANAVIAASLATLEYIAGQPRCVLRGGGIRKSFSGDTPVLMADGSSKSIEDVRVGDLVLATDPQTGQQGPREVTATWAHPDDLFALTVDDDKIITTTEDHLFWNVTDQRWDRADQLDRGDILLDPDGSDVTVTTFSYRERHVASAYTLTVDGIHTHYVLAGTTPVLVHNDNGGIDLSNATEVRGRFPVGGALDAGGPADGILYRTQNGTISNYAVYDADGVILRRVDLVGAAHGGVPTPHVQEFTRNVAPDGRIFPQQSRIATPAGPGDLPRVGC